MPKRLPSPEQKLVKVMPHLPNEKRVRDSSERHDPNASREKRVGYHLGRLAALKGKPNVEARIWQSAINELLIHKQDIPESYWRQQQQILRDNGNGNMELDDDSRHEHAEQLINAQRTSAESWATYLEQTGEQYPLWFKFYAWDGMSKLGKFDKVKGKFRKRDATTIAPYPQLNPAALAKTFDSLEQTFDGKTPDDPKLAELAKSGNFNSLYTHNLLEQKAIIPTPENPEDIHGEWRHYTSDDVEAITRAAEGTTWCIEGERMASSYTQSGGSFYLFHLQDTETNSLSPTAAASIRVDSGGNVAEVSGLKGGESQYVEDALIPEVMAKVASLPGGERYQVAFEDKQKLIVMDRKYQNGEDFSLDEIKFLYELDRKILYIDTYAEDPRPEEFKKDKKKHADRLREEYSLIDVQFITQSSNIEINVDRALEAGVTANIIVCKLGYFNLADNLDKLLAAGATIDVDELVNELSLTYVADNLDKLLAAGATIDVDELVNKLHPLHVADNLDKLLAAGATIDVDELVNELHPLYVVDNLDKLLAAGATIDVDELVNELSLTDVVHNLDNLLAAGVTADKLAKKLHPLYVVDNLDKLLAAGATIDVDELVNELHPLYVVDYLDNLLAAGATIDTLMNRLYPEDITRNLDKLLAAGATIDIDNLVDRLRDDCLVEHLDQLIAAGATEEALNKRIV